MASIGRCFEDWPWSSNNNLMLFVGTVALSLLERNRRVDEDCRFDP